MSPDEIVDVSGRLSEIGTVGILLFFLISLLAGIGIITWAIYRQAFGNGKKEGFVERFILKHNEFLDRVAIAVERVAETSEETVAVSRKIDSTVNKLHAFMVRSNLDIIAFSRAWKHKIEVFRIMAAKVGLLEEISDKLTAMESIVDEIAKDHQ